MKSERTEEGTVYSLELNDLPAVHREEYIGSRLNALPFVGFSTMKELKDVVSWYNGLLAGTSDYADEAFLSRFKGRGFEETLRMVYGYVSREIDLRGKELYDPDKASDTMYRKSGTVEDKAVLAKSMLEGLGIKSYVALVKGGAFPYTGTSCRRTCFPNVLLYVPAGKGEGEWLDFSNQYYGCGTVSESVAGTDAMVINSRRVRAEKSADAGRGRIERSFRFDLDPSGDAKFAVALTYTGGAGRPGRISGTGRTRRTI